MTDLPIKYRSPYESLVEKNYIKGLNKESKKIDTMFKLIGNAVGFKLKPKNEEIDKSGTKDQAETDLSLRLVQEAIQKTSSYVGDGSYTTTTLAAAMTSLVVKSLQEGCDPKALKRGIEKGVETAINYLNDISMPIVTPNELDQIAKTVTNGDIPLAEAITDAFVEVGRDGWIEIEEGNAGFDCLEKIKGIKINSGFISPEFNNEGERVFYHEIYLLLSEDVLMTKKCVLPAITAATNEKYPLLILAKGFEGEALQTLLNCRRQEKMKICAVKTPELDEFGRRLLLDLAISCEATVFSDKILCMLEEIRPKQHFGLAWSANIDQDRTIITTKPSARSNNSRVRRSIKEIKAKIMVEENLKEKDILRERLARFVQRTAVIKVGGNSQEQVKERCQVAQKAVTSLRAALEEGAVPGGGSALVKCLGTQNTQIVDDFQRGFDIVRKALWVPCMVAAKNAGLNPTELAVRVHQLREQEGFDLCTKRLVNMYNEGILDPTKVLTSGLRFAAEVTIGLTTEYQKSSEANKKL